MKNIIYSSSFKLCLRLLMILLLFDGNNINSQTSSTCSTQVICPTITNNQFNDIYADASGNSKHTVFNWESCDCQNWYARTLSAGVVKISNPFYDGVNSQALASIKDMNDYHKSQGWELLLHDFGQISATNDFYFILYNKNTGIMRVFWYNFAGAYNVITNGKAVFTLSYLSNKPTGSLSLSNPAVSASDKYLNNGIDGTKDVIAYIAPAFSRGTQWLVGEFQLGFDSFIKDGSYQNSSLQIQIAGIQTSTLQFTTTGTATTMDSDQYYASDPSVNAVSISAKSTKVGTTITKLETMSTSAIKHIKNADEFRKKIAETSANLYNNLASTNSVFLKENVMKPAAKINDLTKDGALFSEIFGKASKVLGAFTGGIDVLKSVGSMLGVLSDSPEAATPTPVRPTVSTYDLKSSGAIELTSPQFTITLKVPGTSTNLTGDNRLTYYDCPTGIISLDNTPILQKFNYNRLVEKISSFVCNSSQCNVNTGIGGTTNYINNYIPYSSYKLVNDLSLSFNGSSDLEIVDIKASLISEGSFDFTESFSSNSSDGTYRRSFFNPIVSDIGLKILELYKYDPENKLNTIGTPLINFKQLKGVTLTVPSNVNIYLQVIGVFKRKNNSLAPPVIFKQKYEVKTEQSQVADNPDYNSSFLSKPPYANYNNQFNDFLYNVNYSEGNIPLSPYYTTTTGSCSGHTCTTIYNIVNPQQSGIFSQSLVNLNISNTKTSNSKCMILANGLPSTNCTPTTDPIIFQASNVVLKNNVVFSKDSRVIVRNPNLGYSLPPASSGSVINTLTAPSSCYNSTAILMRKGIIEEIESTKPFPNPVTDGLLNFGTQVSSFEILSISGNTVISGSNTERINVENLASGLYILKYDGKTDKIVIP